MNKECVEQLIRELMIEIGEELGRLNMVYPEACCQVNVTVVEE